MIQCPHCAKTFKSRSGLRRHSNREHPVDEMKAQSHEDPVTDDQDADAPPPSEDFADVQLPRGDGKEDEAMLKAALKALDIKRHNVMAYRVYPNKVAIIEAPKGWKKTWYRED